MAIYIVQHGKCLPEDMDPERMLSEEGISDVKRIALVANGYGIKPSIIYHSGKIRALQTAAIFQAMLAPEDGIQEISGINPADDVARFARTLKPANPIMYVGHLPFMERLISFLITGDMNIPVFKLQNGGILCMDIDRDTQRWVIKWGLMPHIRQPD